MNDNEYIGGPEAATNFIRCLYPHFLNAERIRDQGINKRYIHIPGFGEFTIRMAERSHSNFKDYKCSFIHMCYMGDNQEWYSPIKIRIEASVSCIDTNPFDIHFIIDYTEIRVYVDDPNGIYSNPEEVLINLMLAL